MRPARKTHPLATLGLSVLFSLWLLSILHYFRIVEITLWVAVVIMLLGGLVFFLFFGRLPISRQSETATRRDISSDATALYKFGLPLLSLGLGIGLLVLFLIQGSGVSVVMPFVGLGLSAVFIYGLPVLFLGFGIGLYAVGMIQQSTGVSYLIPYFVISGLGGAFASYWYTGSAKKVTIHNGSLIISNYRDKIVVPLRDVESVAGSRFLTPDRVWINLRKPTQFDTRIMFVPKRRWFRFFRFFSVHPIVEELERLIQEHRR